MKCNNLIAWFNLVYGLYISDLYLLLLYIQKVYTNIIKGNIFNKILRQLHIIKKYLLQNIISLIFVHS